ncbi:hypothetical protein [Desulfobacter latus]|uniref:Flagellar assembly protein T N-terminal domain-containing protein n=1 Tax=Desulfobacter latus TaxID=2292 RepID=A0A850SYI9_9BACT|nr:hypothetical protein [Desulfobacter latus]NWH06374.1 hypothetical protein [Desulfobacter latus]
MVFKLRFLLIACIIVVFYFPLTGVIAAGQDSVHITTGRHEISGQDTVGAKKAAVRDALEKAVQNAFTSMISPQQLGKNLDFLYDQLLVRTMDFVSTYRLINGIVHNGAYLVGVESKISLELVEKHLHDSGIFNQARNNPKVLLLIGEQGPEDTQPLSWWWQPADQSYNSIAEKSLTAVFDQARIPLVVTGNNYPDPAAYHVIFSAMDDQTAAMAMGQALGADMVVLGMASARKSANRMGNEKTFEADVSFTILDMASRKEVIHTTAAATAKSVNSRGADQALAQAADTAGQMMKEKIQVFWAQAMKAKSTFDLYVEGDNFLIRFIALKRQLKEIREIENISPRELGSSHAIMEVTYKGPPTQFANAVMLKTFEDFGIEVSMVSDNAVKIKFVAFPDKNAVPQPPQNLPNMNAAQPDTSFQGSDKGQGIVQETLHE